MIVDGDLQGDEEVSVKLEQRQVFQGGEGEGERPSVGERELLGGVVGVDEPPAI